MRRLHLTWLSLFALACAGPEGTGDPTSSTGTSCAEDDAYPAGAVEPMALGAVLTPYRWPQAIHRGSAVETALDLVKVPCASDPVIDWSPFDVLLFVSIPAW